MSSNIRCSGLSRQRGYSTSRMASVFSRSKPHGNVWDALGRQVAGRNYPPTNKNTLIRANTEKWDKLPQQLLDNVVQSHEENVGVGHHPRPNSLQCHPARFNFPNPEVGGAARTTVPRLCRGQEPENNSSVIGGISEIGRKIFVQENSGARNRDNVERRGWNERRMFTDEDKRRNWGNSEVLHRPNNDRNHYRRNYETGCQRNQWVESRNGFNRDDRRFNDRGSSREIEFKVKILVDGTAEIGIRVQILVEKLYGIEVRRNPLYPCILGVDFISGSNVVLDFDRKALEIPDSQIEKSCYND
ncbi:uncharacterized protein TNCV_2636941 [Trichonephila clavipes]|uniref:Uncharacterized protein n=1 Tax=Trichonephila clavipes TaxID=2585209 RepID=A0A8X6R7U2_TRICX|nr:uncharacterized protein TNCV_2636941 [Trichonephila clavipes]